MLATQLFLVFGQASFDLCFSSSRRIMSGPRSVYFVKANAYNRAFAPSCAVMLIFSMQQRQVGSSWFCLLLCLKFQYPVHFVGLNRLILQLRFLKPYDYLQIFTMTFSGMINLLLGFNMLWEIIVRSVSYPLCTRLFLITYQHFTQ